MTKSDVVNKLVNSAMKEGALGPNVTDRYEPLFKLLRSWAKSQDIESFSAACAHCYTARQPNLWCLEEHVPSILLNFYLGERLGTTKLGDWHRTVVAQGIDWAFGIRSSFRDASRLRQELDSVVEAANERS
jgi:hypothetical protein